MTASISQENILAAFDDYGSERHNWLIGGEYERIIVQKNGLPISYDQTHGIRWFLEQFQKRWNWNPIKENDNLIALHKDGASITLEPGGQFELSGRPHKTLETLSLEFEHNRNCIKALTNEANLTTITCGLTPIAPINSIHWMPKGRYDIMKAYLPQKGDRALFMMKGTASVQCNYDFEHEADCAKKVQLCSGLAPLTTALFANSPLYQNKPTGYMSYRGEIWTRTDPDRTGFPPGLRNDYTHKRWVNYLLDVPMMFIKRSKWIHAHGRSFRSFINDGIEGHFPTWSDWDLHMTSVFPEVRIKKTIEVRGADCVPHDLALSFCALFTALLYDNEALDRGLELCAQFTALQNRQERFHLACKEGLRGKLKDSSGTGHPLSWWAEQLLDIAQGGLERIEPKNKHLLLPLIKQVATGGSPAEQLLAQWHEDSTPSTIVAFSQY